MMDDILIDGCSRMGISIGEDQLRKFIKYYEMIVEWNERMNLTAITEEEEVAKKHFLDSIVAITKKYIKSSDTVIDVGTGAGFPGIPIKIIDNAIHMTLLDSLKKRTIFLEEVRSALQLQDLNIYHGRAEDFGRNPDFREKFDVAVSRAVAEMNVLLELALPFVKIGGIFIAYKGPGAFEEAERSSNALDTLGGICETIQPIDIPGLDANHYLTIIRKSKHTPTNYPRKAGKPEKSPLK